jgi:hypothetical protein
MTVEVTEANRERCICPSCATYDECMTAEDEALYCGTAVTICDINKIECICGDCGVFSQYGLVGSYYCETGPAE